MLRGKVQVTPKTPKAQEIYAKYLNSKPIVTIEHKRLDRWFFSSPDNPDFWFWVNIPYDNDWSYYELT